MRYRQTRFDEFRDWIRYGKWEHTYKKWVGNTAITFGTVVLPVIALIMSAFFIGQFLAFTTS